MKVPIISLVEVGNTPRTTAFCGNSIIGTIDESNVVPNYCAVLHFIYDPDVNTRNFNTYEDSRNFILESFREYWDNLEFAEVGDD